jgi:polar amino acid transport system permease protein
MSFDFDLLLRFAPLLLSGLLVTVVICIFAGISAAIVGLIVALGLLSKYAIIRWASRVYVEVMRGTPVLIVLFLMYYGGPSIGITLSAQTVGVFGMGLYGAAYFGEIFRSGFQSIPPGQTEAARMLGISKLQITLRIHIPQMMTLILPPLTNQFVILVKESAVLSIITVSELTKNTTQMVNETFATLEPYLAAAALYWIVIEVIAWAGNKLEKKVRH